ncbi:hypothetical protein FRB98_003536 [Tulasnella sp. 332]|nr:hypothetical protein FRB98_003536 [Tulasnella sp. 332]
MTSGIVGDSLIIWRLYIIWSRSKRIIIAPVIALIAYGAGGVLICYCEFRTVLYNNDDRFLSITADLTLFTILGGLATNLYSTSLIVGRIWWTGRQVQMIASTAIERRRHAYMPIIRALVESAALHTATMITTVIASILVKNASIIFGHIDPMVIGIAPTLLVLQLNIVKLKTSGESTLGLKQGGAGGVTTIRFSPMNPSTTVNTGTDMLGTFDTGVGANGQWDGPRDIENQACRLESVQKSKGVVEDMVSVDNKEKPSGVEDKDEKAQTFELKEEAR